MTIHPHIAKRARRTLPREAKVAKADIAKATCLGKRLSGKEPKAVAKGEVWHLQDQVPFTHLLYRCSDQPMAVVALQSQVATTFR